MPNGRLRLCRLDPTYVRELAKVDRNVPSTLPEEGKANRPFVGIVVVRGDKKYCVPLSSPKAKHEHMKADRDFSKILDRGGKLIGVLNFNNMLPVSDAVLMDLDLRVQHDDTPAEKAYKQLMVDQLRWCNDNRDLIRHKAAKLYDIVTLHPQSARGLVRRCCDFKLLETVLKGYCSRAGQDVSAYQ